MNGAVFDKEVKIVLYGAGVRGYECYCYLKQKNYNIQYVVDKNPSQVERKYDCKVVSLDTLVQSNLEDSIVIVCLLNGLLHDAIADELHKKGARYILFLPTCRRYRNEAIMRKCYRSLLEGWIGESCVIPSYEEMVSLTDASDIIIDEFDMVTCWVTIEYIYSKSERNEKNEHIIQHISQAKSYLALFEYLQGGDQYPKKYLTITRGDDIEQQHQLLEDRAQLWTLYEEKINTDTRYFIEAAPNAIWDSKKARIQITDGHHRAVYMYYKGWYEMPIRLSRDDYQMYKQYCQMQMWKILERNTRVSLAKTCIELIDWMNSHNIVVRDVFEKETNGYVRWWLGHNGLIEAECDCQLIVLLSENNVIDSTKEEKTYVITSRTRAQKLGIKECHKLYSGYIMGKREEIGVYYIDSSRELC